MKTFILVITLLFSNATWSAEAGAKCNLETGWYYSTQEGRRSVFVSCYEHQGKKYQAFWTPSYTDRESSHGCNGPVRFYGTATCLDSRCNFGDSGDYAKTSGQINFELNVSSLISYYAKLRNEYCNDNPAIKE